MKSEEWLGLELNDPKLVQEHDGNAERRDEADEEEPEAVDTNRGSAPVRELIAHHLARCYPADEDTRREGSERQEDIRREEVTEVEEVLSTHLDIYCATRERTGDADKDGYDSLDDGALWPRNMQFLKEERRTDLVHGDRRGEGCQSQECIEQNADDITQDRSESLLKDVRQRDEDQRRATVRVHAYRERRGEDHQASKDSNEGIDKRYLHRGFQEVRLTCEVRCVGTKTGGAERQ